MLNEHMKSLVSQAGAGTGRQVTLFRHMNELLIRYDHHSLTFDPQLRACALHLEAHNEMDSLRERLRTDVRSLHELLQQDQSQTMNYILFALGVLGLIDAVTGFEILLNNLPGIWLQSTLGLSISVLAFAAIIFRR